MTLSLEDNEGNLVLDWDPGKDKWWIIGFNPNYNRKAKNLTVKGIIDFSHNKDMWDAFYDEFKLLLFKN